MKNYREFLEEYVTNLDEDELLFLNNEYTEYDEIYYNDEYFLDTFFTPTEAVRAVCYGEYKYLDRYVIINAYGNLESADFLSDLICISDLIDCLEDGRYLLDEYEKNNVA